jgi:hypothetical protein
MKLTDKEIAYRRGRDDEKKKLIDELVRWKLNLLNDAKDMDQVNRELLLYFVEAIDSQLEKMGYRR